MTAKSQVPLKEENRAPPESTHHMDKSLRDHHLNPNRRKHHVREYEPEQIPTKQTQQTLNSLEDSI